MVRAGAKNECQLNIKNWIIKVTECGLLNFKNTKLEDDSDSVCKWMNLEKKFL